MKKIVTIASLAMIALCTPAAQGVTVIYDPFTTRGVGPGPLDGWTASTGQTWTTSGGESLSYVDGDRVFFNSAGNGLSGRIGISVATNSVYMLTVDVSVVSSGTTTNWLALGFSDMSQTNQLIFNDGAMLWRANNNLQLFNTGLTSPQDITASLGSGTMGVELTTGSTLANSTLRYLQNGSYVGASRSTDASGISSVFLQVTDDTSAQADNFTLTRVPEPSSFMLGFGLISLSLIRRRSR